MMLKRKRRTMNRTATISTNRAYCVFVIISSALHILIGLIPTIILSMRKQKYRKIKSLIQGHTGRREEGHITSHKSEMPKYSVYCNFGIKTTVPYDPFNDFFCKIKIFNFLSLLILLIHHLLKIIKTNTKSTIHGPSLF